MTYEAPDVCMYVVCMYIGDDDVAVHLCKMFTSAACMLLAWQQATHTSTMMYVLQKGRGEEKKRHCVEFDVFNYKCRNPKLEM